MFAEHYSFSTEQEADAARQRFIGRGWTTSSVWQHSNVEWKVTVLHS